MEVFEVHITGDKSILDAGKKLGVKTIEIDLLKPDKTRLRTEYMTSLVTKHEDFFECKHYVDGLAADLHELGVKICRVKIECPYYEHYKRVSSYMESHFESEEMFFPTSRNVRKTTLLATDREYDREKYAHFLEQYKNCDVELCLYDTYVAEDLDWFQSY